MAGGRGIIGADGKLLIRSDGTVDVCEDCCDCPASVNADIAGVLLDCTTCYIFNGDSWQHTGINVNAVGVSVPFNLEATVGGFVVCRFVQTVAQTAAFTWDFWFGGAGTCIAPPDVLGQLNSFIITITTFKATGNIRTVSVAHGGSNARGFLYQNLAGGDAIGSTVGNQFTCGAAPYSYPMSTSGTVRVYA